MMKYVLALLLISNLSWAQGVKHRGQLVKVISPTTIQVKEDKKPITLTLRGVSDKNLTKDQKTKAVNVLQEKLKGQVLIWEEFKDGAELYPGGVGQLSRTLLEEGVLSLDKKAPESYKPYQESAQNKSVGIWEQKK